MASVKINFTFNLDQTISVGDALYSSGSTTSSGGVTTSDDSSGSSTPTELGEITALNRALQSDGSTAGAHVTIDTVLTEASVNSNVDPAMLLFYTKNNNVNLSSILGYYAEVKMKNNSTVEAELFQVTLDTFESSGHA